MTLPRSSPLKAARQKKCATCREPFTPRSTMHTVCSPFCAGLHVVKERKKAEAKADRATRYRLKTRNEWIKEAQQAFNAYIRERDKDKPCICCGRTSNKQYLTGINWDCGHYRSTGSAPHLRFNEDNAHRQLTFCNRNRAGNAVEYRRGLIARIGLERVEALEADQSPAKWTIPELQAIKAAYKAKLKELKAEPTKWEYSEGEPTECPEPERSEESE